MTLEDYIKTIIKIIQDNNYSIYSFESLIYKWLSPDKLKFILQKYKNIKLINQEILVLEKNNSYLENPKGYLNLSYMQINYLKKSNIFIKYLQKDKEILKIVHDWDFMIYENYKKLSNTERESYLKSLELEQVEKLLII
jgi:hypothetical protein